MADPTPSGAGPPTAASACRASATSRGRVSGSGNGQGGVALRRRVAMPPVPQSGGGRFLASLLGLLVLGGCAEVAVRGPLAPYRVGGRTYVPLADWRGFREEGVASWYDHHGRPTAAGERQDVRALTAAHPVLPLHVCVRVENLENGRVVTVRINDRGPFVDGRVIDLTPAAARALGMLAAGTARVRLTALGPATARGECPTSRADAGAEAAAGRA